MKSLHPNVLTLKPKIARHWEDESHPARVLWSRFQVPVGTTFSGAELLSGLFDQEIEFTKPSSPNEWMSERSGARLLLAKGVDPQPTYTRSESGGVAKTRDAKHPTFFHAGPVVRTDSAEGLLATLVAASLHPYSAVINGAELNVRGWWHSLMNADGIKRLDHTITRAMYKRHWPARYHADVDAMFDEAERCRAEGDEVGVSRAFNKHTLNRVLHKSQRRDIPTPYYAAFRRSKEEFDDVGQRLLVLDIDGLDEFTLDAHAKPGTAVAFAHQAGDRVLYDDELLRQQLVGGVEKLLAHSPVDLSGVSYVVQATGSWAMKEEFRARVWFIFPRLVARDDVRAIYSALNLALAQYKTPNPYKRGVKGAVDVALSADRQIVYVAPPQFKDVENPIPAHGGRFYLVRKGAAEISGEQLEGLVAAGWAAINTLKHYERFVPIGTVPGYSEVQAARAAVREAEFEASWARMELAHNNWPEVPEEYLAKFRADAERTKSELDASRAHLTELETELYAKHEQLQHERNEARAGLKTKRERNTAPPVEFKPQYDEEELQRMIEASELLHTRKHGEALAGAAAAFMQGAVKKIVKSDRGDRYDTLTPLFFRAGAMARQGMLPEDIAETLRDAYINRFCLDFSFTNTDATGKDTSVAFKRRSELELQKDQDTLRKCIASFNKGLQEGILAMDYLIKPAADMATKSYPKGAIIRNAGRRIAFRLRAYLNALVNVRHYPETDNGGSEFQHWRRPYGREEMIRAAILNRIESERTGQQVRHSWYEALYFDPTCVADPKHKREGLEYLIMPLSAFQRVIAAEAQARIDQGLELPAELFGSLEKCLRTLVKLEYLPESVVTFKKSGFTLRNKYSIWDRKLLNDESAWDPAVLPYLPEDEPCIEFQAYKIVAATGQKWDRWQQCRAFAEDPHIGFKHVVTHLKDEAKKAKSANVVTDNTSLEVWKTIATFRANDQTMKAHFLFDHWGLKNSVKTEFDPHAGFVSSKLEWGGYTFNAERHAKTVTSSTLFLFMDHKKRDANLVVPMLDKGRINLDFLVSSVDLYKVTADLFGSAKQWAGEAKGFAWRDLADLPTVQGLNAMRTSIVASLTGYEWLDDELRKSVRFAYFNRMSGVLGAWLRHARGDGWSMYATPQ